MLANHAYNSYGAFLAATTSLIPYKGAPNNQLLVDTNQYPLLVQADQMADASNSTHRTQPSVLVASPFFIAPKCCNCIQAHWLLLPSTKTILSFYPPPPCTEPGNEELSAVLNQSSVQPMRYPSFLENNYTTIMRIHPSLSFIPFLRLRTTYVLSPCINPFGVWKVLLMKKLPHTSEKALLDHATDGQKPDGCSSPTLFFCQNFSSPPIFLPSTINTDSIIIIKPPPWNSGSGFQLETHFNHFRNGDKEAVVA